MRYYLQSGKNEACHTAVVFTCVLLRTPFSAQLITENLKELSFMRVITIILAILETKTGI